MECIHITVHIKMQSTCMMTYRASIRITLDKTGACVGHYNLEGTH
jgi:stress response protein SCP2